MGKSKYTVEGLGDYNRSQFKNGVSYQFLGASARHVRPTRAHASTSNVLTIMAMFSIILGAVLLLACPCQQYHIPRGSATDDTQQQIPALSFKHDGTFQISIFEDLHFGESMSPNVVLHLTFKVYS